MPELLPFTPLHAARVAGWPRSAVEAQNWCGAATFPVPEQLVLDWQQDDDVRSQILITDGAPVGYGELWIDVEEDEIELARLIIDPAVRRRGLGRALVRLLVAQAQDLGPGDIFLRVNPANEIARRLYLGCGFTPVAATLAAEWNAAQPFAYHWLHYSPG